MLFIILFLAIRRETKHLRTYQYSILEVLRNRQYSIFAYMGLIPINGKKHNIPIQNQSSINKCSLRLIIATIWYKTMNHRDKSNQVFTAPSGSPPNGKEKSETGSGDENWSWTLIEANAKEGDLTALLQAEN